MAALTVSGKTYNKRIWLKTHGFTYNGGSKYITYTSDREAVKLERKCRKMGLRTRLKTSFTERSTNYRNIFFQANKPVFGKYYICAYCGCLMTREQTTVDHLIPIGAAQKSEYMRKKMLRMGYDSVNDVRNLVPACERCNQKKSAKTGRWITRGRIGRHAWVWAARKIVRAVIIIAIIYIFVKSYTEEGFLEYVWANFTRDMQELGNAIRNIRDRL